ncbi:MAG: SGNH/GDSL hydrolase family protein [Clostridiales bacterium]|nr:SGNH/GDSL hydrolase family protein [Clostridiales bacterium]
MKKKIIASVLIIAFLIAGLWFAQRLLMPKYMGKIVEGAMVEEYYKETTDHDVIFIGDCEVYENFSTMELWKEYGITSYIRGSSQQLVWQSYYLLEETLKYEKPKVVVFNVLSLKYDKPQKEAYNRMTLDGMKWSMSKVNDIKASMTEGENFIDYVFPILRYHSRWNELTGDDLKYIFEKEKVTHNGYYMRVDIRPQGEFPDPMPLDDYSFGENSMKYLDMMTKLCKDNGIELVLIKAPTEYPYWYEEWDEQVKEYADQNGLNYINMIPLKDEIGLDMSVDTYDAGLHLNLTGAEKMSDYFGKWLVDTYGLEDHRNDPKYTKVYEEKIEYYNKMIEEQKNKTEE